MNAVENQVRELVEVELAAANERFPQFHSAHEGWAVIKEEVEETEEESYRMSLFCEGAWQDIKSDIPAKTEINIKCLRESAINAACEAIQVAAMCQKFLEMEGKR